MSLCLRRYYRDVERAQCRGLAIFRVGLLIESTDRVGRHDPILAGDKSAGASTLKSMAARYGGSVIVALVVPDNADAVVLSRHWSAAGRPAIVDAA